MRLVGMEGVWKKYRKLEPPTILGGPYQSFEYFTIEFSMMDSLSSIVHGVRYNNSSVSEDSQFHEEGS